MHLTALLPVFHESFVLRRYAKAMHIIESTQVAKETPLLSGSHTRPDVTDHVAQVNKRLIPGVSCLFDLADT
jgi:hypothetical protein